LILIGYLVAFYKTVFAKEREEKQKTPWKWQVAMTVLMIIFWWYFDNCREYLWFLIIALIGSGLIYGRFFWLNKNKPETK